MSQYADESLMSDFVAECRDHLNAIEPDLLTLEEQHNNVPKEIINRVFRAIHSIKGGSSFLSLESLKQLSHAMENVLMLVRNEKLEITQEIMDVLLRSVDVLRAMLDDVQASDDIECAEEIRQLNEIAEGKPVSTTAQETVPAPKPKPQKSPQEPAQLAESTQENMDVAETDEPKASNWIDKIDAFVIDHPTLDDALRHGMFFYFITTKNQEQVDPLSEELKSLGKVLGVRKAPDGTMEFCAASVLDMDMFPTGISTPNVEIASIPKESMRVWKVRDTEEISAETTEITKKNTEKPNTRKNVGVSKHDVVETLRVRVDLLTQLMNMAGELVLGRNQLMRALETVVDDVPGLLGILQNIDRVTSELQEGIMQTRMQAVGVLFGKFPRLVRDLSRKLGKDIRLEIEGAEVELDKSIVEMLSDPLTHIIRNCVDHAIELPEERLARHKPKTGHVRLVAYHEGGQVNISISDDGNGIDRNKVIQKALEKGIYDAQQLEKMSERELLNLIFAPGFSTAKEVSDISGRGVGMDVVKTNIEKLGGHIELESEYGRGTTILLRLPLTLAIIPSLIIGVGESRFAVPQVSIKELVWVRAHEFADRMDTIRGAPVLRLRGRLLPLVRLADVLGIERTFTDPETGERKTDRRERIADRRDQGGYVRPGKASNRRNENDRRESWHSDCNILVLKNGQNLFGIIVDRLFDGEEIVVKPLSTYLKDIKMFAGTTILGDGSVIMILDAAGIATKAKLSFTEFQEENKLSKEKFEAEAKLQESRTRSVIMFTNNPEEIFAVEQEKILRLERVAKSDIRTMGQRSFIHYLGKGLPVVRLDEHISVDPMPEDGEDVFLLIPKCAGDDTKKQAQAGIIVTNIIDALDVDVELQPPLVQGPGMIGSAIIHEKLTSFLNPQEILYSAGIACEADACDREAL